MTEGYIDYLPNKTFAERMHKGTADPIRRVNAIQYEKKIEVDNQEGSLLVIFDKDKFKK